MESQRPPTSLREPSSVPLVLLGAALVAAAAGGLWWFLGRSPSPPPPPASAPAASAEPAAPASDAGAPVDPARLRMMLEGLSSNPLLRDWLLAPELAKRLAVVVENLSNGVVPRKQLESIGPKAPFAVTRRGATATIDPRSFQRFDPVADAVASVDAGAVAAVYGALRPTVELAYRALGYPDGSVDRAASRALSLIERAPVRDGEIAVVEGTGSTWAYADPELERLGDVEKQVLRMGPRNGRILQQKAREISRALGWTIH